MEVTDTSVNDPLWRCINRENEVARSLVKKVRADLKNLEKLCKAEVKSTNDLRVLMQNITTDTVPQAWRKYVIPAAMTVTEWLSDFSNRIKQLEHLHKSDLRTTELWLGGLFFPEAFLTASRQSTAFSMKLSLEELQLVVDIGASRSDNSFIVKGLYMEGAKWNMSDGGQLDLTDDLTVPLPDTRLKWVHRDSDEYKKTVEYLKVPVYVNGNRRNLLSPFSARTPNGVDRAVWLQRSVCITLWTKL
jgi:dynein heavy chain 1